MSRRKSFTFPGLGIFLGLGVVLLILMGGALLLLKAALPMGVINFIGKLGLSAGAYIAGYITAKRRRKNGLMCGIVCGLIIALIGFISGWIIFGVPGSFLLRGILLGICGGIGGVVGVNTKRVGR